MRGGAVIAIQTAGDRLKWHPHLHGLVPDDAARCKRKKLAAQFVAIPPTGVATKEPTDGPEAGPDPDGDTNDFRRECRGNWARLIQKIYEVDPSVTSRC